MEASKIEFRKLLIKNLKRNRQWTGPEVLINLSNFSKTPEFDIAYKKWLACQKPSKFGPREIKEILKEMIS